MAGQCAQPQRLVVDVALVLLITVVVLLITDGTAMQTALSVLFPLQPLAVIYLLRRWTPHLWGAGGRRAMGTMADFGLVLLAMAVGVLAYSLLRTALGELLISARDTRARARPDHPGARRDVHDRRGRTAVRRLARRAP